MAANRTLTHEGDGTPSGRVTAAGYRWYVVLENLAEGQTSIDQIIQMWLDSPAHCRNIANDRVTRAGVGSALGTDGRWYWTMLFALPR